MIRDCRLIGEQWRWTDWNDQNNVLLFAGPEAKSTTGRISAILTIAAIIAVFATIVPNDSAKCSVIYGGWSKVIKLYEIRGFVENSVGPALQLGSVWQRGVQRHTHFQVINRLANELIPL